MIQEETLTKTDTITTTKIEDTHSKETYTTEERLAALEQVTTLKDLLAFVNETFDSKDITATDKGTILTRAKGQLNILLTNLTTLLKTRNNLPGLSTRDVTRIDTSRSKVVERYQLTGEETTFIDGYDYAKNSLQILIENLNSLYIT